MKKPDRGKALRRPARASRLATLAAVLAHPGLLRAGPAVGLFLLRYMRGFKVRKAGRNLILHSHLPPLNSRAYGRFVREHLLARLPGPSHAQVAVTDACPQRCAYCYNRGRSGRRLETGEILRVIGELRDLGVFWLGLTGGEPLLQRDLVEIVRAASSRDMAVKLFTTGLGLTPARAAALRDAGLFSVSVSLDDPDERVHDGIRGYPGAYRAALDAIRALGETPGLDVGVSAVFSREAIESARAEEVVAFLAGLGIDEAWLSEAKPSVSAMWGGGAVISEEGRRSLSALQERWNRRRGLTVNYLGHFEGASAFGCTAGRKMLYVDAFGEVGPCVFAPLGFGNVRSAPLREIYAGMARSFEPADRCFMNANHGLFAAFAGKPLPLGPEDSRALAARAEFAPPAEFFRIFKMPGPPKSESASAEEGRRDA